MEDLLTTRQVQDLLKVDRITIYRMLSDGRLKGIKVGNQWRFLISEVEKVTSGALQSNTPGASSASKPNFPRHCVQAIQDVFADIGQVAAVTVGPDGSPLTAISHPCPFCELLQSNPSALQACLSSWKEIAARLLVKNDPEYFTCHAGLNLAAAPIRFNGQYLGCLLAEQFYIRPPETNRLNRQMRDLAAIHEIPVQALSRAAGQIPILDETRVHCVNDWPRQVTVSIISILSERANLTGRLQQIAEISSGV